MYGLEPRTGSPESYNYVIGRGAPPEGTVVARDGEAWLVSLGRAQCAPDPAYDWHLE
jgi:streptogramin lyase